MSEILNHNIIIKYDDIEKIDSIQHDHRKNLLLISPMLHQGGFERICVATARIMKDDYNVTIVIFSDEDVAYDVSGLNVVNLDLGVRNGQLAKTLNILKRKRRLKALEKRLHADIVYSFGLSAGIVNCMSADRYGKYKEGKYNSADMDNKHKHIMRYVGLRGYADLECTYVMKLYAARADGIISCSQLIEDGFKKNFGGKKNYVLYNPCDIDQIKRDAAKGTIDVPFPEGTKIIVSLGREVHLKDFPFMVGAFRYIHEKNPETGLMIVGEGTYNSEKRLAEDLGISDSVYFTGLQTEPYKFLKRGYIYLLTSFTEGFPNAMVEAMSLGIPVVSVNCKSGPAEILDCAATYEAKNVVYGKCGIVCPEVTEEDFHNDNTMQRKERIFADATLSLMSDRVMYDKYSDMSEERASFFSVESYRKNLIAILGE